jgi:Fe-S oxidoreductase
MEEAPDKRVSHRRIEEVLNTKASCVATACPYCLSMFDDALKEKGAGDSCMVMDICELVAKVIPDE